MRINNVTPILANYKAKQQVKSFTQSPTSCPALMPAAKRLPLPTFTGLPFQTAVRKTILPEILQRASGEIHEIELLDKLKNEKIRGFLRYSDYPKGLGDGKALMVYNPEGKMIGSVGLDFSEWKKAIPLKENHVRLQFLANNARDTYAGIGSTIVQAAIEQSLKTDAKGRIYVFAKNITDSNSDPFVFYKKMGLSVVDPHGNAPDLNKYLRSLPTTDMVGLTKLPLDEQLLVLYKKLAAHIGRKIDQIHLDFSEFMFLHDSKVKDFWLPKIQANPIFGESSKLK